MKLLTILLTLLLSGCTSHKIINDLYPDWADKYAVTNSQLYLIQESSSGHRELKLTKTAYYKEEVIVEVPIGSKIYIKEFKIHRRFTEYGTELFGHVFVNDLKYRYYYFVNGAYDGIKVEKSFPWDK
jgi:hypothetical protein